VRNGDVRDLYEVSCDETDFIVDFLRSEGIKGARMVGGGFGGGVVVLDERERISEVFERLKKSYRERFSIEPSLLVVESVGAAEEVV